MEVKLSWLGADVKEPTHHITWKYWASWLICYMYLASVCDSENHSTSNSICLIFNRLYHSALLTNTLTELRSFRPMSCSPGVVSPGVWSHFTQNKSPHLQVCSWAPILERGIFTHLLQLFICVKLIIRSITKNVELDLILSILRSNRWSRKGPIFNPAKRLHTPGKTTPGEQDTGQNNLLPSDYN